MKRGREEKSHETFPSPTRLRHDGNIDIPFDLMVEILKKLPTKSLVRFLCVSKLWSSTISRSRNFIGSIVTRSLTQPPREAHIIYYHRYIPDEECYLAFKSSSFPRNIDKFSLLSIPQQMRQYVHGLIFSWFDSHNHVAIYNPTTRQTFYLPVPEPLYTATCFFGYDPIENQYKALFIPLICMEQICQVFTLGDSTWRTIQGVKYHFPMANVVCVNGVIYYRARNHDDDSTSEYKLMSFDVRSEKFCDHAEAPKTLMDHNTTLINYQGKLAFVCCEKDMEIWVMENANKGAQVWSRSFFYEKRKGFKGLRNHGATRGGEIVYSIHYYEYGESVCIFYYDPKQNRLRYVDLKYTYPAERRMGYTPSPSVWCVPDHIENTMCLYQTIS